LLFACGWLQGLTCLHLEAWKAAGDVLYLLLFGFLFRLLLLFVFGLFDVRKAVFGRGSRFNILTKFKSLIHDFFDCKYLLLVYSRLEVVGHQQGDQLCSEQHTLKWRYCQHT
jgi:hypothetical protein